MPDTKEHLRIVCEHAMKAPLGRSNGEDQTVRTDCIKALVAHFGMENFSLTDAFLAFTMNYLTQQKPHQGGPS